MDFSHDIIQHVTTIFGNITETVVLGTAGYDVHVISVSMQQEKDLSDTTFVCGADVIAKNYGKDLPQVFLHYHCDSQDLQLVKTGADEATITILYATSSQHEYMHNVEIENQLNGAELLLIAGIIIFLLSFGNWRYMFRLSTR